MMNQELKNLRVIFPPKAKVYLVGGCVRDFIINKNFGNIKDYDVEVHNLTLDEVENYLIKSFIKYSKVGKSFGVFKVKTDNGTEFDISLPRKDSKKSSGHCGFDVKIDPYMGIQEALKRRDFTINAIAIELCTNYGFIDFCYHDYYGGLVDLKNRILRMVDPETFGDDPLRVLRGIQFAGRFGLTVDPETFKKMKELV